ncbi:hypothetical protein [Arthrobacter sp. NPDC093139]|uniref:hypothetical protein n=1 Tax=Arthrobacter sp. NPDC093139 TaxID=3363945 RepID=UPI00380F0353
MAGSLFNCAGLPAGFRGLVPELRRQLPLAGGHSTPRTPAMFESLRAGLRARVLV